MEKSNAKLCCSPSSLRDNDGWRTSVHLTDYTLVLKFLRTRVNQEVRISSVWLVLRCSSQDGLLGPRGLLEATEMCTQECLVLGHSDNCWMPPALGTYQQPKSPVSGFGSSQREWGPKDALLNGHTLTRSWKHQGARSDHFGDGKMFGSGEGHFSSSGNMADIPLKSYQPASCPESPKE
ncbi:hypothetical protein NHX12_005240 [Muraenolepis orangiensis]|uniref:Protocadherin-9 n=1 Tax=Muraenolepis orangiensis TaxID=630683 RepID=A0A9Q0IA80_9TELE|nr:hypothetical protein NHX12_005240 [Muraenolepis orangiensis]